MVLSNVRGQVPPGNSMPRGSRHIKIISREPQEGFAFIAALIIVGTTALIGGAAYATGVSPKDFVTGAWRFINPPVWNTRKEPDLEGRETKKEEGSSCVVKELSRQCIDCNLARATKQRWDCSKYTEIVADQSCTSECYQSAEEENLDLPQPAPVASPSEPEPSSVDKDTEASMRTLVDIFAKMLEIQGDINIYGRFIGEAVEARSNCREDLLGDSEWFPEAEKYIAECKDGWDESIDDYEEKISKLERELNEYERQKNDIISDCYECAEFWYDVQKELDDRRGN